MCQAQPIPGPQSQGHFQFELRVLNQSFSWKSALTAVFLVLWEYSGNRSSEECFWAICGFRGSLVRMRYLQLVQLVQLVVNAAQWPSRGTLYTQCHGICQHLCIFTVSGSLMYLELIWRQEVIKPGRSSPCPASPVAHQTKSCPWSPQDEGRLSKPSNLAEVVQPVRHAWTTQGKSKRKTTRF